MATIKKFCHDKRVLRTLIQEVRKPGRKFLYDPTEKDYRNNVLREAVWKDISKVLDMEKYACQRLWKSMRQKYKLALIKSKSYDGESRTPKPIVLFLLKELDFMKDIFATDVKESIADDPYFDSKFCNYESSSSVSSVADLGNKTWGTEDSKVEQLSQLDCVDNSLVIEESTGLATTSDPLKGRRNSYVQDDDANCMVDDELSEPSSEEESPEKKLCRIPNSIFYEESSNSPVVENVYQRRIELIERELSSSRKRLKTFISSVQQHLDRRENLFYQSLQQEMEKLSEDKQRELKIMFMKAVFDEQSAWKASK